MLISAMLLTALLAPLPRTRPRRRRRRRAHAGA